MAEPADLLAYNNTEAFRVILDTIMNCTLKGISMPSQMVCRQANISFFIWTSHSHSLTFPFIYLFFLHGSYSQISIILKNSPELQAPSSLTSARLAEIAPLLPLVGGAFLQRLTASQLLPALPALSAIPFSAAQVKLSFQHLHRYSLCTLLYLHNLMVSWQSKMNILLL